MHGVIAELTAITGPEWVRTSKSELLPFDSDALPGYHRLPSLVVLPGTPEEVAAVIKVLAAHGLSFVPRGAGTGLSGGALADNAVVVGVNRLTRIVEIDADNRIAHVEAGVVNATLSRRAAPFGLHYAPDPGSQSACTIGGNVAENAGGPHCLKYGVTLNHIAALRVVLPDGSFAMLGDPYGESDGYDLTGLFVGSEGCFGIATDVWVKLVPLPPAVRTLLADFDSIESAAHAVSAIIASGIVPAALEMMDRATIRAIEGSIYKAGYPTDVEAILLVEVDGMAAALEEDVREIERFLKAAGAGNIHVAANDSERDALWQGRKKAFGAMGRVAPALVVQDATVPRTKLPEVLRRVQEIGAAHGVHVCNVFHAGDGNLHPNIPYNPYDVVESERVHAAMTEIMAVCIAAGGTITGEHGVGVDKVAYMEQLYSPDTIAAMCAVRRAFDPAGIANPDKVLPVGRCMELGAQ